MNISICMECEINDGVAIAGNEPDSMFIPLGLVSIS